MSAFLNEVESRSQQVVSCVTRIKNSWRNKKRTDQTRKDFLLDWLCVKLMVNIESFIKIIKTQ